MHLPTHQSPLQHAMLDDGERAWNHLHASLAKCSAPAATTEAPKKVVNKSNSFKPGMSPEAWQALLQRGKEYALNLLISGPWAAIKEKYTDLDARIGAERCQETSILCLIIGSTLVNALKQRGMHSSAKEAIAQYRDEHETDKPWQEVRVLEDVNCGKLNSPNYTELMGVVHEVIGNDKVEFVGWAYTITSFSVFSNCESGLPIKYRRKGEARVQTTQTQRDLGMGEYYDAEFSLRSKFSDRQFDLMLNLCNQLFPDGIEPPIFGDHPQERSTYLEQLREVFYFSRCQKINDGHPDYPITVSSFSASGEILIKTAYKFGLVIILNLPRLAYEKSDQSADEEAAEHLDVEHDAAWDEGRCGGVVVDDTSSVTYKIRSIPTVVYVPDRTNGSYKAVVDIPDDFKDEPVWRLGGYSMYSQSGLGSGLSSCDDDEFSDTLLKTDVCHMLSIFNFFHNEFPAGVKEPIDVLDLVKTVCGGRSTNKLERTLEFSIGWSLEVDQAADSANLLEVMNASAAIAREYDLFDTVFARQLDPNAKSCFTTTSKSIPFTFIHIEISTIRYETTFWSSLLTVHVDNDITMYQHLFTIGSQLFSTAEKSKADAWMKASNANKITDEYLALQPDRLLLLTEDARVRYYKRKAVKPEKEAKKAKHCARGNFTGRIGKHVIENKGLSKDVLG